MYGQNRESELPVENQQIQKRCEPPNIYPLENILYIDSQISFELVGKETEQFMKKSGLIPLNDKNSTIYKNAMAGRQNQFYNEILPPANNEKSFVRYTIDSDMLPSFYNGIKGDTYKVDEKHQGSKIKVSAVTCRFGYMDSKVKTVVYQKRNEKQVLDYRGIVRPSAQPPGSSSYNQYTDMSLARYDSLPSV